MTSQEGVQQAAVEYAKTHKKEIAHELTDLTKFPADPEPVVVFMAGSPGAGKTEASERLIERFSGDGHRVLRIDSDDLRTRLPGYTGQNSSLFQGATSIIADKMQDEAIEQRQSYVFDGTLANLERARENIQRCLSHGYAVQILYVYQNPEQAWKFVKAREIRDGRMVPKEAFIEQYFTARENVNALKKEFASKIRVDLIVKNIDGTDFRYKENVSAVDNFIPERYTREALDQLIQ